MKIPTLSADLVDALRSRFFAKDRSIYLASNCLAYLSNGAYLSNAFISETILSASAASVTFSNIPQGFRHLMILAQARSDQAAEIDTLICRFNGDTGSNYDYSQIQNGVYSATRPATFVTCGFTEAANSRAAAYSLTQVVISAYSRAGIDKYSSGYGGCFGNLSADADLFYLTVYGHWRNTNVITSVTLSLTPGPNFVSGSRFQLYGIL